MNLWNESVDTFREEMKSAKISRGYIVTDPGTGKVVASHPVLQSIADAVAADTRDYLRHEGCFFEIGRRSDHLLSAHVHWT